MKYSVRKYTTDIPTTRSNALLTFGRLVLPLIIALSLAWGITCVAYGAGGDKLWDATDTRSGKQVPLASAVDSAGNVIVTGYQNRDGNTDDEYLTVKFSTTDSGATVSWRAAFNKGTGSDQATAVAVDSLNNVIVTGFVWNGLNKDIHTVKYDPDGNVLWEHTFNGPANNNDEATSIAIDSLNNIYVGGYTTNASGTHYLILKYSTGRNSITEPSSEHPPVWQVIHNETVASTEQVNSIAAGPGGVAVTGHSWNGTDLDCLTIKYDSNGNQLMIGDTPIEWRYASQASSGTREDKGKYVKIDKNGDVIVTGYTSNALDIDIYTAKYEGGTGALSWERIYNGQYEDEPNGLFVDQQGDVYITGYTWSVTARNDFYTAKYIGLGPDKGTLKWEKTFNSANNNDDIATSTGIVVDEGGDVFVTGYTIGANYDFQTVKYKKDDGTELWHTSYNSTANKDDRPVGIGLHPLTGEVFVAGWSDMTVYLDSGALTAASSTDTLENANAVGWSDNRWAGKYLVITSGANKWSTRYIQGNTAATLTLSYPFALPVEAGATYYIFDGIEDLDYTLVKYDPGLINRPTDLTAKVQEGDTVLLKWRDNSNNEKGFNVWRKKGDSGDWERIVPAAPALPADPTTGSNDELVNPYVTFIDTAVEKNVYYHYRVTAVKSSDGSESHPSDPASVLTFFVTYTQPVKAITQKSLDGGSHNNYAVAVSVGPDNQPVVTGTMMQTDSAMDYYTMKLNNSDLSVRWGNIYNDPDSGGDSAVCVAVDSTNAVIVSGFSELSNGSGNTNHIYSLKYPAGGSPVSWHHKYVNSAGLDDRASAIAAAVDGSNNVAVVGHGKNANGNDDIFVIKYPQTPDIDPATGYAKPVWSAIPFDRGGDDMPLAVAFGPSGDLFVTGFSKNTSTGHLGIFTAKYDKNSGTRVWTDFLDNSYGDNKGLAITVAVDRDGKAYPYVAGFVTNSSGNRDIYTIKYDSVTGARLQERPFNGPAPNADDEAVAIAVDPIDGAIVVAGNSMTNAGEHDFTVIRYTPDLVPVWTPEAKTLQRPDNDDIVTAMALDNSGNIFVTGYTTTGLTADSMTLKYSYDGVLLEAVTYDGAGHGFDETNAIAVNSLGEAFVAGYATNADVPSTTDYLVYKMDKAKLQVPYPLTVTADYAAVSLSWPDNSSEEAGFRIRRKVGPCSKDNIWTDGDIVKTTNADETTYIDSGLTDGQAYCYRVSAFKSNGEESRGAERQVTTSVIPVPGSFSAVPVDTTTVNLGWTETVNGETGFKVERCEGIDCVNMMTVQNATSFTDSSACSGKTYTYRVQPIDRGLSLDGGGKWSRRILLSITGFQPNFQTKVTVAYDGNTTLAGSPMKADFSDIRFYDDNALRELPHWLETKTDGGTATFWVKTGTSSKIYAYYGNPSATSASNGPATFQFFDHFEGSSLSPQWGKDVTGIASLTVDSSVATLDSTVNSNGKSYVYLGVGMTPPYRVEARVNPTNTYMENSVIRNRGLHSGASGDAGFFNRWSSQPSIVFDNVWTNITIPTNQYVRWRAAHVGGDANTWGVYNENGTQIYLGSYSGTPSGVHFTAGDTNTNNNQGGNGKMLLDWVFVRKYAAVEPVATTATAEQQAGGYSFSGIYDGPATAPLRVITYLPGNLLADSDFENATTSWNGAVNTTAGSSFDSTEVYTGTKSLKLTATGATLGRSQTVSVTPGQQYTLSGYMKSVKTGGPLTAKIQCDVSGTNIDTAGITMTGTSDWSYQTETTVPIPAGTTSVAIRCFADGGFQGSAWFDHIQFVPTPVVSALTATRISDMQINLAWTDTTTDETGFKVERKCESNTGFSPCPDNIFHQVGSILPAQTGTGAMTFNDTGLVPETTYSYRITALKNGACGWNNAISAIATEKTTVIPSVVTSVTPFDTTRLDVAWTDSVVSNYWYRVERCAGTPATCTQDTNFNLIRGAFTESYKDTEACAGVDYTYRVSPVYNGISLGGGASWAWRAPLAFASNSFIPNFKTRLTIPYNAAMKPDFSDIRFFDATTSKEIPYYLESKTDSGSAIVWIKAGDYNTIYMYYGNDSAISASTIDAVFGSGLMGYWAFNEIDPVSGRIKDLSGMGNDVTPAAHFTSPDGIVATGKYGNALSLDGTGDYANSNAVNLPAGAGTAASIEAWIYPTGYPDSYWNGIVSWGQRSSIASSMILAIQYTGRPSIATWSNDFTPYAGPVATLNAWNHIAAVIDGKTATATVYMNGQPISGPLNNGRIPSLQSVNLSIGSTDYPGRYFKGRIDEVRIYNRALTSQEIATSYAAVLPSASVNFAAAEASPAISPEWRGPNSAVTALATGKTAVPTKPTGFSVTWASEVKLKLDWTDNTTDESGYYIERKCVSGSGCADNSYHQVASLPPHDGVGAMTYIDDNSGAGLSPNHVYAYRVRPYKNAACTTVWDNAGGVLYSDEKSATTTVKDPSNLAAALSFGTRCNDIRITDSVGTVLPIWMREDCNTSATLLFARVETLPKDLSTVYMYYGNTTVPAAFDGTATFEFFDDFTGNSIDTTNKWTATNGTGFSVSGGYLHGTNTSGRLTSKKTFSSSSLPVLQVRAKTMAIATHGQVISGFFGSNANSVGWLNYPGAMKYLLNSAETANTSEAPLNNLLTHNIIVSDAANLSVNIVNFDLRNNYWVPAGPLAKTITNLPIVLGKRYDDAYAGETYATDWDWVYVRKNAIPAPTITFGASEYNTPLTVPYTVGSVSLYGRKPITVNNQTGAAITNGFQLWLNADTTTLATDQITISWKDEIATESGYTIKRCDAGPAGSPNCDPSGAPDYATIGPNSTATGSYTDENLPLDKRYCYAIKAVVPGAVTGFSTAALCADTSKPTAPFNLTKSITGTRVDLSWSDNTTAIPDSYIVERCSDHDSITCSFDPADALANFKSIVVPRTQKSYSDTDTCTGISYHYRVKSVKPWIANWPAGYSNVADALLAGPPKPTVLTAQKISETQINLTWTDNTTDETGYRVERKCVSGPAAPTASCPDYVNFYPVKELADNPGTGQMSYSDAGLATNTTYIYQVKALKGTGEGCGWPVASDQSLPVSLTIAAPANLTATPINTTRIDLAWEDKTVGESGFTIERCLNASCDPVETSFTVGVGETSYSDQTVCINPTYYYRVKTFKSDNLSLAGGGRWKKSVPLQITNFQPNFQTKLTVKNADYSGMQSDFKDVRFYDEDAKTELPYWIESISGGIATIWIKTGGNGRVSLYYDNTSAASTSSANAVFEFYDDFNNGVVDTSKWTITDATGFSVSAGNLHGTNTTGRLTSKATFSGSTPVTLEIKARTTTASTNGQALGGLFLAANNNIGWMIDTSYYQHYPIKNSQAYRSNTLFTTANLLYTLQVKNSSTVSQQIYNLDTAQPDQYQGTGQDTSFSVVNMPIVLGRSYKDDLHNNQAYATDWDWIRVRKYAATEPAVSLGTTGSSTGYTFVNNWDRDSDPSNTANAKTPAPVSPSGLVATRASEAQMNLVWSDPAIDKTDRTGFKIERCTGGSCVFSTSDPTFKTTNVGNVTTFSDTPLMPDTTYQYQVRAYKTTASCEWNSDPTNIASDVTTAYAPVDLTAAAPNTTQIDLSWIDNTLTEKGFAIERCEGNGCANFSKLDSAVPGSTTNMVRYTFNNTLQDSSGTGLHLSGSTPTYEDGGLALSTTTYFSSPPTNILDTDNHTIEFDMKIRATNYNWTQIFGYFPPDVTSPRSPGIWLYEKDHALLHWRYNPGNTGVNALGVTGDSLLATPFSIGTWYHIRGVKNGSNFKVYIDGATTPIVDMTVANPKTSGSAALSFGGADVTLKNFSISRNMTYADKSVCNNVSYTYQVKAVNNGLSLDNGGCWTIKAPLTFTNNSYQPNYQTKLTIKDSNYPGMQSDYRDIRFYDETAKKELPYWIEKVSAGDNTATVWLKTGGNEAISMYYGNDKAKPAGSGEDTFEFFDDFDGAAIDAGKWTINDGTGFSVSNSLLHGTTTTGKLTSIPTFRMGTILEVKAKTTRTAISGQLIGGFLSRDNQNYYFEWIGINNAAKITQLNADGAAAAIPSTNVLYVVKRDKPASANASAYNYDTSAVITGLGPTDYSGWSGYVIGDTQSNIVLGRILYPDYGVARMNEMYATDWDWIRVRRYAATEPVVVVSAGNTSGCYSFAGAWPVSFTTNTVQKTIAPPLAPSNLVVNATDKQVTLTWIDNTTDESGFKIAKCTGEGCTPTAELSPQAANTTAYNDPNLTPGTTYCYQVWAYKTASCGWNTAKTPVVCATTSAGGPYDLTATASGPFKVALNWRQTPSSDEDGFEIERQTVNGDWMRTATVGKDVTTYADTVGVEPLKSYRYRVRAYKAATISDTFDSGIDSASWQQEGAHRNGATDKETVSTPPINFVDADGAAKVALVDGKVELSTSAPGNASLNGTNNYAQLMLQKPGMLHGDFDVQIDYSLPDGALVSPTMIQYYMRLRIVFPNTAGGRNDVFIERSMNNGVVGNDYFARTWMDGATTYKAIPTSDSAGKLRIARSGDVVHFYAWTGGSWLLVDSVAGVSTAPASSVLLTQYANRGEAVMLRAFIDNFLAKVQSKSEYSNVATVTYTDPDTGATIPTTPAYKPGVAGCP